MESRNSGFLDVDSPFRRIFSTSKFTLRRGFGVEFICILERNLNKPFSRSNSIYFHANKGENRYDMISLAKSYDKNNFYIVP
jgi:hypothetical protein